MEELEADGSQAFGGALLEVFVKAAKREKAKTGRMKFCQKYCGGIPLKEGDVVLVDSIFQEILTRGGGKNLIGQWFPLVKGPSARIFAETVCSNMRTV